MEKQSNTNQNGSKLPRAKDFKMPKKLTKEQEESLEAFREAMKASKEEAKYGKKPIFDTSMYSDYTEEIERISRLRFFRQSFYMN